MWEGCGVFPNLTREKLKDYGKSSFKNGSFISGKRKFYSMPLAKCCILFSITSIHSIIQKANKKKLGYSALCQVRSQVCKTGTWETNLREVWCETLRSKKRKVPIFSAQLIFNSDYATLRNFHKKCRSPPAERLPHVVPTQLHGTSLWILSTIKNKKVSSKQSKAELQCSRTIKHQSGTLDYKAPGPISAAFWKGLGFFSHVMNIAEIYFPHDSTKVILSQF